MKHNLLDDGQPSNKWPNIFLADELLERLSGYKGYPPTPKGREVFNEALLTCLSPEHAKRVVDSFDDRFPTLRELRDVIVKTRQIYEPTIDLKKKWEREGATYDPDFLPNAIREALDAKEQNLTKQRKLLLDIRDGLAKEATKPAKETPEETALREALEQIDGGYDLPN